MLRCLLKRKCTYYYCLYCESTNSNDEQVNLLPSRAPHDYAHKKHHLYVHKSGVYFTFMRDKMFYLAFYSAFLCNEQPTR